MNEIEEYISQFDPLTKQQLLEVYEIFKNSLPDAKQKISYGVPTFYNENGYIAYFAGYKDFVSVYPVHLAPSIKTDIKPYLSGKSTARFDNNKPLPADLIHKAVLALLRANLDRAAKRTKQA